MSCSAVEIVALTLTAGHSCIRDESACEAIETGGVRVEQRRETIAAVTRHVGRQRCGERMCVHAFLNASLRQIVGAQPPSAILTSG
jgi:hypothetical protein